MRITRIIGVAVLAAGGLALLSLKRTVTWQSRFVHLHGDGSLSYQPGKKGDVIPDFSRVGYHQGDAIPDVPVRLTVRATDTNSQAVIQQAIDELSLAPADSNGFRGAILLTKGTYRIPGTLHIRASGIVLRGEGDGPYGTVLVASGKGKRTLLSITGTGRPEEIAGTRTRITDAYVPVGAFSFRVADPSLYQPGDRIMLWRPGTVRWIHDLKMDAIVPRKGTRQWQPTEYNLGFERTVTHVEGNRIFIDNPVVMGMEDKYGGGYIYKYRFPGRLQEDGVEDIRFRSDYNGQYDEDHGWTAIAMNDLENGWVRHVTSLYFGYSCVSLGHEALQITVTGSRCLDPKSIITGGRRYSFNNNGQLNLFMHLKTRGGRHDFVTGARTAGPNVFYDCVAREAHADIGPHHRWSMGTLYDNIRTDGEINVQDRGNWGSGHGWAGVNQVIWNCMAKRAAVQDPWVSGHNYCIGLTGEKFSGRLPGRLDGIWEGQNQPGLQPRSLYLAQKAARESSGL
jgi:hypothetical protein